MRILLLIALLLSQPAKAALEFDLAFAVGPSQACLDYFRAIVKDHVSLPSEEGQVQLFGTDNFRNLVLVLDGHPYPNPVDLLNAWVRNDPAAAKDAVVLDGILQMGNPVDPSRFAVLCVSGNCGLKSNGHGVDGLHVAEQLGLAFGKVSVSDPEAALKILRAGAAKSALPELEHSTVTLRLPTPGKLAKDHRSAVFEWYANALHEGVHASADLLLFDWLRANRKLLQTGGTPDGLFLKYVTLKEGEWVIDETFYFTYHEGLAYSVTANAFNGVADLAKAPHLKPDFAQKEYQDKQFDAYTGTRPEIRTELGLDAGNWFQKMREVRERMLATVALSNN